MFVPGFISVITFNNYSYNYSYHYLFQLLLQLLAPGLLQEYTMSLHNVLEMGYALESIPH